MGAWVWRILSILLLTGVTAGVVIGLGFPDVAYRWGITWIQSYRARVAGELSIADAGYWLPIHRGVEKRIVTIRRGGGHKLDLFALRVDPSKVNVRVVAASPDAVPENSLEAVFAKSDALALFNGSFFSPELGILGLCVVEGRVVRPLARLAENQGVLAVREGSAGIYDTEKYVVGKEQYAIQSGPWLVRGGVATADFGPGDRVTRRTCVGQDKRGRLTFVITDTLFSGITLSDLASLMQAPMARGGFEAQDAINLDGGTSSQMVLRAGSDRHLVRGFVNVPVLIGIYP